MAKHPWGRSEKYKLRQRTLYALLFSTGYAYIGQSADVVEREKQHRRPAGGWAGKPFRLVVLEQRKCTRAHAEELEYAWRLKASRAGWGVYAKPPGEVCNPWRRATPRRRWLALWRRWPWRHSRRKWRLVLILAGIVGVLGWRLISG